MSSSSLFISLLANEFQLSETKIEAVVQLLEQGNTIPFIARYRKERTGNVNEVQIKDIQEKLLYWKELEQRRQTILHSINSQGKLTEDLRQQIVECKSKTTLEDFYLPYKPKRRTRAMIAREKGLEDLATIILQQPIQVSPSTAALSFVNPDKNVNSIEEALAGAEDIVAEKIAEDSSIRALVRKLLFVEGVLIAKVKKDKAEQITKFNQYYDFKESVKTIPSHRYLAIRRGEKEGIVDCFFTIESDPILKQIEIIINTNEKSLFASHLKNAIEDSYHRLIYPSVETDIRMELKMSSDREAVHIFADNLRHLLLAAPLGSYVVIGIDPGIRTGCKCAIVDFTGKYLDNATLYLSQGEQEINKAIKNLKIFIDKYNPYAIAIGNGTAGRETEQFVKQFLKEQQRTDILLVQVNEAGASIYSASEIAREEFPELDITVRGAISIARRLQDPLAELVKVEPKSIGVGQYQHDVHQPLLQEQLQYIVESCVNKVGVDLNTASVSLLSYVAGIGSSLAQKIVKYRETHGAFIRRQQLKEINGFGPKTFEQSAGFLRIRNGDNPLDSSAVHPEQYSLVEEMAKDLKISVSQLLQQPHIVSTIDLKKYADNIGEFTLKDILEELKKPGRDPRTQFTPPKFREDVLTMNDLKPGMWLEGVITNVTAFGAFADIGVHQDGLIHLSELSDRFIKHPSEVVKPGDKIQVRVLSIDIPRKRISLTAKKEANRSSTKPEAKHHSKSFSTPLGNFL